MSIPDLNTLFVGIFHGYKEMKGGFDRGSNIGNYQVHTSMCGRLHVRMIAP